jgi:hypothetical protein
MSFETEARTHTADESEAIESNGERVVRTPTSEPELGDERPYVRGETFVMKSTHAPASEKASSPEQSAPADAAGPLFDQTVAQGFRSRWNEIQVAFVDAPRDAVREADRLVSATIKELTDSFTDGRQKLEEEWNRGGEDSTEALRLAFQRYRSYFNRLLSV